VLAAHYRPVAPWRSDDAGHHLALK